MLPPAAKLIHTEHIVFIKWVRNLMLHRKARSSASRVLPNSSCRIPLSTLVAFSRLSADNCFNLLREDRDSSGLSSAADEAVVAAVATAAVSAVVVVAAVGAAAVVTVYSEKA